MNNKITFLYRSILTLVLGILLVQDNYFFDDTFKKCFPAHGHTISSLDHHLPVVRNVQQEQKQNSYSTHSEILLETGFADICFKRIFSQLNYSGNAVVQQRFKRLLSSQVFSSSL